VHSRLDRFSREGTAQTINYLRTLDGYDVRSPPCARGQPHEMPGVLKARVEASVLEMERQRTEDSGQANDPGPIRNYPPYRS
jgi:hypothetical protein